MHVDGDTVVAVYLRNAGHLLDLACTRARFRARAYALLVTPAECNPTLPAPALPPSGQTTFFLGIGLFLLAACFVLRDAGTG